MFLPARFHQNCQAGLVAVSINGLNIFHQLSVLSAVKAQSGHRDEAEVKLMYIYLTR